MRHCLANQLLQPAPTPAPQSEGYADVVNGGTQLERAGRVVGCADLSGNEQGSL